MKIRPYIRLVAFILILTGTIMANNILSMAVFWLSIIFPLVIWNQLVKRHIRFIKVVISPILIMLFIVYGLILKAPPNRPIGSDAAGGYLYAAFIVMRLILLAGAFQVFLSIKHSDLIYNLKSWGLKGDILYIVIGAFSIWSDVVHKADKIVTARYARGLIPNRNWISRIKQIPYVIRPLITGLLRLAIDRSDSWKERDTLLRFEHISITRQMSIKSDEIFVFTLSILWFLYNLYGYIKI